MFPRAICAAVWAIVCAVALVPTAAHADQYVVDHCSGPGGTPSVAFQSITGQTSNTCGQQSGALLVQEPTSRLANSGDRRDVVLSVPADRPNIQIERMVTQYSVPAISVGAGTFGRVFMPIFNQFGDEIFNAEATDTGPTTPEVDRALPPGNRLLKWSVLCAGGNCVFSEQLILKVFRTRLYLNESVAPTLTVTGGTLLTGGAKAGQVSVGFDAADTDSGVRSVTVSLGGTLVGGVEFPCAIKDWSVCKRDQVGQILQVDTTKVPDGNHELIVTARDAANNALTRSSGLITIANGAAAAVSVPNGAGASRLAKLSARFTTTTKRSRRLGFGGRPTVKGTLLDEQGQPIGAATIAVLARAKQAGAADAQIATATTGPDGAFSVKLPSGPSRTLTFAYTAFSGDATPASTATLRTVVRAIVSASMPRSVQAGRRVALTGRLRLLGRAGVEIRIQARDGRVWRTTDVVRTTSGGRFRWNYRFRQTARGRTFFLRARVASPIYPFAGANSKPIRVRVR